MINNHMISNVMDILVPITRFNKGEANKIFDEVRKTGSKIVVKNNAPACVLLSPETYNELINEIEEMKLYALVNERLSCNEKDYISHDNIMIELGLSKVDLNNIPVEYGVDFE